jgi:hypothetical protein
MVREDYRKYNASNFQALTDKVGFAANMSLGLTRKAVKFLS